MNKLYGIAGVLAVSMLVGCASVKQEDFCSSGLKVQTVACIRPKIEIMQQDFVSGTATVKKFMGFTTEAPNVFAREMSYGCDVRRLSDAEQAAMYEACANAGATILLAPRFTEEIETTGFLGLCKTVTVTVEGIPARIVGAEEVPAGAKF